MGATGELVDSVTCELLSLDDSGKCKEPAIWRATMPEGDSKLCCDKHKKHVERIEKGAGEKHRCKFRFIL